MVFVHGANYLMIKKIAKETFTLILIHYNLQFSPPYCCILPLNARIFFNSSDILLELPMEIFNF